MFSVAASNSRELDGELLSSVPMRCLPEPRSGAGTRACERSRNACVALVVSALFLAAPNARADIDGDIYTSANHRVRAEIPRGWRVSEASGYPNVLLWMSRSKPRVKILVVFDPVDPRCRATGSTFCSADPSQALAALEPQLVSAGFALTAKKESRTPELEYEAGRRYVRHALVVVGDIVISVVLTADSSADRANQSRAFERLTQSIRSFTPRVL